MDDFDAFLISIRNLLMLMSTSSMPEVSNLSHIDSNHLLDHLKVLYYNLSKPISNPLINMTVSLDFDDGWSYFISNFCWN